MKNLKYIVLLTIAFLAVSCEDVVDIDLKTAEPKLVIDAPILWQKGTAGNEQMIKLTTTGDYYATTVPPASGATVFITDSNNNVFNFIENMQTGEYFCDNFIPVLNTDYELTVVYKNETYSAKETLKPAPSIDRIEQKNDGGFSGDEIEIKIFYTDDGATEDYYLSRYKTNFTAIPLYGWISDEFFQGNQIFGFYSHEDLKSGDTLDYSLLGISKTYYNYMNVLGGIVGGGGPFQTPPATLRGNVINTTNFNNYALGYFNLSEMDSTRYIVE